MLPTLVFAGGRPRVTDGSAGPTAVVGSAAATTPAPPPRIALPLRRPLP
eukprot:gene11934-6144_t